MGWNGLLNKGFKELGRDRLVRQRGQRFGAREAYGQKKNRMVLLHQKEKLEEVKRLIFRPYYDSRRGLFGLGLD